jgi:hypothetical protein
MAWKLVLTTQMPQRQECNCKRRRWRPLAALALLLGVIPLLVNQRQQIQTAPQTESSTAPIVALLPNSLDFSGQLIESESEPRTVEVRNRGSSDLNVQSVQIAGENAGDFRLADTCVGGPTHPGQGCSISAVFRPTATGLRTAKVNIVDDAAESPQSLTLTGTGFVRASTTHAVTLRNSGGVRIKITQVWLSDDNNFKLSDTQQCLYKSLDPGEGCNFELQYTPSSPISNGTICTPELISQGRNAPDSRDGETVQVIATTCMDTAESSESGTTPECKDGKISFIGFCKHKH